MFLSQPENPTNQIIEQPVFSLEITKTKEDFVVWSNFAIQKNINNANLKLWLRSFAICFIAIVISASTVREFIIQEISNSPFSWLIGFLLIFLIIYTFLGYFFLRFFESQKIKKFVTNRSGFLEKTEFSFYEDKLQAKNSYAQIIHNYSTFPNFYEDRDYLFLTTKKAEAVIFPKKFFTSEQLEFIKNKVESAKEKI